VGSASVLRCVLTKLMPAVRHRHTVGGCAVQAGLVSSAPASEHIIIIIIIIIT